VVHRTGHCSVFGACHVWKGNRVKPFPKWFWWLNCPTQIIGLTSLLYISSTGSKGSTQTNKKSKIGFKKKGAKPTKGCPGLAHRTVRCTKEINSELLSFGFLESHSAIIHRTVRCSTRLSGVPCGATAIAPTVVCKSEQWTLQCTDSARRVRACARLRIGQWTVIVRCTTGLSSGPSCQSSNGRTLTVGWRGWRTGQCAVRPSTDSLPNGHFGGWGYKYPLTTTLQGIQVFSHYIQHKSSRLQSKTQTRDQILSQVQDHSKHLVTSEREIFVFIWVLVAWIAFLLHPFLFSSKL
jgi:hypothetical protein